MSEGHFTYGCEGEGEGDMNEVDLSGVTKLQLFTVLSKIYTKQVTGEGVSVGSSLSLGVIINILDRINESHRDRVETIVSLQRSLRAVESKYAQLDGFSAEMVLETRSNILEDFKEQMESSFEKRFNESGLPDGTATANAFLLKEDDDDGYL